jgi:tRNA(adenine34) deaminase
MVDSIQYFMQAALDIARAGLEKGELPMGAVVVVNDQIIAAAHTHKKSRSADYSFMPNC